MTRKKKLSPAELRVFDLVLKGEENKEIAVALNLSVSTVKHHVRAILRKRNAPNRVKLIAEELHQRVYGLPLLRKGSA